MELSPELRAVVLYAPQPDYPRVLAERGVRGWGKYRLIINPKTGTVTELKVLKHARFAVLDELAAKAFLQWRFRPGTITETRFDFEFSATGYGRHVH
jgi:TonB family protein